jgi:hypothetical protein
MIGGTGLDRLVDVQGRRATVRVVAPRGPGFAPIGHDRVGVAGRAKRHLGEL